MEQTKKEKTKILWVDDDIDVALSSFKEELEDAGYHVLRAQTPDEAWEQLEQHSIAAIIMDVMLPTGTIIDRDASNRGMYAGLRLLEKIWAELPKYANTPALIFTVLSKDKELNSWAKQYKIKVLLKTEIYPEDLVEAVKEMLGEKEEAKP